MRAMPRRRPPVWLVAAWLLLAAVVAVLWSVDVGDEGYRNGGTGAALLLALGLGALWFAFARAYPGRVRAGVLIGVVLALAVASSFVRFEGFSGAMVPTFRLGKDAGDVAMPEPAAGRAGIDLATATPDDFPGFLGPRRDARVPHVRLDPDWEARPPAELWRRPLGEGWSSFAVVNGVAVTMEQRGDEELVTAYDVLTGEPLWARSSPGRFENFLGDDGPRATPAIADGRVFALGATGRLVCLEGKDGSVVWERDLREAYGISDAEEAASFEYGRSSSPLVVGGEVVVPAGGAGTRPGLVAFDAATGEIAWEGPPRRATYGSPTLARLLGKEQILVVNHGSTSGHDPRDGELLWEVEWGGPNPSASQAMAVPPDGVLLSKGYGTGAALVRISRDDAGAYAVEPVWRERRVLRTKLTNVVIADGHAYGLSDGILECVRLATGERAWKEGRYGHGQVLGTREHLLISTEDGEVVLHSLSPDAPRVLGRFQAVEGKTWNNPALYGDVLVVRNASEAAAFRLPVLPSGS